MAITAPRIIFACSIPTILVILSFIWFKKKKETIVRSRSRSSSSSCSTSGLNYIESKDEPQVETSDEPREIVPDTKPETDLLASESIGVGLYEEASPLLSCSVVSCDERRIDDQIAEMVFGTTVEEVVVDDRYVESDKDTLSQAEMTTCQENESTCNSPSSVTDRETILQSPTSDDSCKSVDTKDDDAAVVEPSKNDEEVERQQSEIKIAITNEFQAEMSDMTENVEELRLSPREQCDDEAVTVPVQTATVESNDDTLVSENVESVDGNESPNETITVEMQQEEEEEAQMPPDTHTSSSTALDDEEASTEPSVRCGSATESENDVAITAATSVIAEHPPFVSSPASIADEQDIQKLANGTDTSAYGSASHSPAEELLESPTASNFSDMNSEGSSDSGKGCSEINTISADSSNSGFPFTPLSVFEFELPQDLCGRLIGQRGRYVNFIKSKSKANISIKRHPFNADLKLCAVIGTEEDISNALVLIRKRFPLSRFPCISMMQVNAPLLNNVPIPDTLQLHLPEGVTCDVIMSSLVTAGHFFVQQPTHPTYSSLGRLDQFMLQCYMNGMGAPELPKPVEPGVICSASIMGGWYRAQIVFVHPEIDECEIRFVDYGGYLQTPISSLRQIRSDFMTLPFQASECYLANVVPVDETQGWTPEATSMFEELAQGQILQAQVVTYSDDGIPYVRIYRIQGVMTTFVNRELVDCGFAKWVEHQA